MSIFAKDSIRELREKIHLVEVISSYLPLKKYGANYKALCPFHSEKSPSFFVHEKHYHCFGCSAHGDAISFLMKYVKLSFTEAVSLLAEKYHVHLEMTETVQSGPSTKEIYQVLSQAMRLFHFHLLFTEEGKEAQKYLFERGISLEFIDRYKIGLAPADLKLSMKAFQSWTKDVQILIEAGLVTKSRGSMPFFEARIMFPIFDYGGRVLGFSARNYLAASRGGKYINTPQTTVFNKSKILFGLNTARMHIAKKEEAFIVEGQIDTLRLQYHGYENTVSALGTAFGNEHVDILAKLGVKKVFLVFDHDKAGLNASLKVGQLFQTRSIEAMVVLLPEGEDPDSFLRKHPTSSLDTFIQKAPSYLEFCVYYYRKMGGDTSPAFKQEMIRSILELIHQWPHPIMIFEAKRRLAHLLKIPEELLLSEEVSDQKRKVEEKKPEQDYRLDFALLKYIYFHENASWLQQFLVKNPILEHIESPFVKKCIQEILETGEFDILSFAGFVENPLEEAYIEELLDEVIDVSKTREAIIEIVEKIYTRNWLARREEIKQQIESYKTDEQGLMDLLKKFDAIKNQRPKVHL